MSGVEQLWWMLAAVSAVVGGLVGSFLNVVAWRVPAGMSVVYPPSACPRCGHPIRPYDNVPVLAWLWLRGRCRDCGAPIAIRYPLVEALGVALFALLFVAMIPNPGDLLPLERLAGVGLYSLYFAALLAISLIDLDHFIIPDEISLPLIPLGWTSVAVLAHLGVGTVAVPDAVLGALVGGLGMWTVAVLGRLAFGREAMGMGDVKLMAAFGAWQGALPELLLIVFLASLLGSVVGITLIALRGRERAAILPFGPYLCAAALITWVWGEQIVAVVWPY